MTFDKNETNQTLALVDQLKSMFSDKSIEKKLETMIKNVTYTHKLFTKLANVIDQFDKQGKYFDQQIELSKELINFKHLLDENIQKSNLNSEIISSLEDYLSTLKEHYQFIRNDVQTLENINEKIKKKIQKNKNKNDIGQLIIRAIKDKIPNLIYFDSQQSKSEKNKSEILKEFYNNFLNYISFIRESSQNIFDSDEEYIHNLKNLQTELLSKHSVNIKDYFLKLTNKLIDDNRNYSTDILIQSFVENPLVHISVSNNSKFYSSQFIQIFQKLTTSNQKNSIESLIILIFHLDRIYFKNLNLLIFQNNQIVDVLFKTIYNKGIELYSNSNRSISIKNLKEKFFDLFQLILLNKSDLFDRLRDSIINETNRNQTFDLLSNIYGQHIQCLKLNLSNEIINVKYCFNYLFFKSLTYTTIDDVPIPSLFSQLLFYIHIYHNQINSNYNQNEHEQDLINLKNLFIQINNQQNYIHLKNFIEILKMFINIQTYDFRFKLTIMILSKLKYQFHTNEESNIKIETLKEFFDNTINDNELYLRLIQSFNIHLLKDIFQDQNIILTKLSQYNSNFKLFIDLNKEFKNNFDINQDLTPGFSIPYYLSIQLINDKQYNENNYQIFISILFKVFNCSSDKNKNELNKEFIKLYQSVNQLIQFYNQIYYKDICQQLQKISIQCILDGFSKQNEENLNDRNEYARIIIENIINYKFEHFIKTIELTKSKIEIFNMFNQIITRQNYFSLNDWAQNTSKLSDKLYFLYCYYQYPKEQFDIWFKQLNPNIKNETYTIIDNNTKLIQNQFKDNNQLFKQLNIKYLQHNQIGTLALIYDYLQDSFKNKQNLFIKIGTGQGKSLIIAETVKQIIQINRKYTQIKQKVFVITCYDHLAKIDFQNYQNYYKHFDILSIYCSIESSTKDLCDADVIYTDLKTYFSVLRKDAFNTLMKSERIDLPDFNNAILIMDEVDNLILDSDHIFQEAFPFKLENYNENIRFDQKEDIQKLFQGVFSKEEEEKFAIAIDRWYEKLFYEKQEDDKKNDKRIFQDTLGKQYTFINSFLNELLKESTANFVHFYLHPLVFYCKFKQIIGFSGSITLDGINRLKTLFENKTCLYYEIPPFFGLVNLENNRKFDNKPGIIKKNTFDYLNAIQQEIKSRYSEQPILIFADSFKRPDQDKSDFDYIHEKLIESKQTFLKDSTIIKIVEEADIYKNIHQIGRLGSITLATRIIARGANIKVQKNIPKGLHLLLTYYPERENIYIQMLGRTARQDEKGSYSEITRSHKNFVDIHQITVDRRKIIYHNVNEYFYKNIPSNLKDKNLAIKWNLFSSLMQQLSDAEIDQNDLIQFVDKNIFNL